MEFHSTPQGDATGDVITMLCAESLRADILHCFLASCENMWGCVKRQVGARFSRLSKTDADSACMRACTAEQCSQGLGPQDRASSTGFPEKESQHALGVLLTCL